MPGAYKACIQHAKALLVQGINNALPVLKVLPQLSEASRAELLELWVQALPAHGAAAAEPLQALLPQLSLAEQTLLLPHYVHATLAAPGAAGAGPLLGLLPALPEASRERLLGLLGEAFDQAAPLAREAAAFKSEAAKEKARADKLDGDLTTANRRITFLEKCLVAAENGRKRYEKNWSRCI